jgi:hypothetical protein
MIAGIIRLARSLLDHQSFRPASAARDPWIHIVFTIVAVGQYPFTVMKCPSTDIPWQWFAMSLLNSLEDLLGLERRNAYKRSR